MGIVGETSSKRIAFGDQWAVVRPDQIVPGHADILTEARQYNGVVTLGFGAVIWDANNDPEVEILARVRMNLVAAQGLHSLLGQMITDALKPADTSKAN